VNLFDYQRAGVSHGPRLPSGHVVSSLVTTVSLPLTAAHSVSTPAT
jgi:hypothetical protein